MNCFICGAESIKRHGRANLCAQHRRFIQMQKVAKSDGKYVPSIFQLEAVTPKDMACQDCGVIMNWIDNSNRASGAVLQHYRDGTIAITCMSCNTKHGLMPGDSYREIPAGNKLCSSCKTIKPLSGFHQRKDGKKPYPMTKCKECNLKAQQAWREKNPDKYKLLTKKHNDMKKQNPDKYRELDRKYYLERKDQNHAS